MKPSIPFAGWLALIARVLASAFLPRPDRLPYILSIDPRGARRAPAQASRTARSLPLHAPQV